MTDLDLSRVKRNVAKMVNMNAPEADIDAYISEEGTTVDAVRSFRPGPSGIAADDPRMEYIRRAKENVANGIRPEAGPGHSDVGERFGGMGMNATAGANSALYSTLGAPVDLARGAMNLGIRGVNAATGTDIGMIPEDSFGGSRSIGGMMGAGAPQLDPQNTIASSMEERVARGIGEGAGYALAPEAALAGLMRTGAVSGRAGDMAGQMFGRAASTGAVAGNAAVGAASGGGASAAMEGAPDELKPIAGMVGGLLGGGGAVLAGSVPGLARESVRIGQDAIAPMTAAGRERLAAETLREASSDPAALRASLESGSGELIPGSAPTTFQASGDMGLGGLERGIASKRPELFNQRRADQNAARIKATEGIQKEGSPEAVVSAVRQRMTQVEAEADRIIKRASNVARKRADEVGTGVTPEDAGSTLRASLEAARATVKAQERALWSAVDPDGTLALPAAQTRRQVKDIRKSIPKSAKPQSGEEAAIFDAAASYKGVMPFSELTALQSRIKTEMRAERMANGESPAYSRLIELNSAIQKDLETAIAAKVEVESQAVAAGTMREEDTFAANFLRSQEEWLAQRRINTEQAAGAVGGNRPTGFGADGPGRSRTVSGLAGAAGEAGRQFPNASGHPGLPADALEPNFNEAALERLRSARDATRERAETFDNKSLAPMRARPSTTAPYEMSSAALVARVFAPGTKSLEGIRAYRKAVGDPAAMKALEGYAVDRLRKVALRDDGTLDPAKVESFRRQHADALRAFPALDARFATAAKASDTLAEVAKARKLAIDAAQKGMLGKILGLDDPSDVVRTIGSIFGAQDAAKRMTTIRNIVGTNREAKEGLRKAVVDHITGKFVGNTEAATSGLGTIKADGFQTFVRQNGPALRAAGFSDDELKLMGRVAEDLQRANRSLAAVKIPGQSNTTQDLLQVSKNDGARSMLAKSLIGIGAGGGAMVGGGFTAALGAVGAKALGDMRMAGIEKVDDLLADALLNPARAKVLLATPARQTTDGTWQMLGAMYRRAAAVSGASSLDGNGSGTERREPIRIDVRRAAGGMAR